MNLSLGELINVTAMNRIFKKADTAIFGKDDAGFCIVSDGYFVIRAALSVDAQVALIQRMGVVPHNGECFRRIGKGDAQPFGIDAFTSFMAVETGDPAIDTHIMFEGNGVTVRLYDFTDGFAAVNTQYVDMIAYPESIFMLKKSPTAPVHFTGHGEHMTVLPVRIALPEYIKPRF